MKRFYAVARELYEAQFKLPKRHKELKVDSIKQGGKKYNITLILKWGNKFLLLLIIMKLAHTRT